MKTILTKFLALALTTTALSGCGTYRDPLAMMADPSKNAIPQDMSLPVNQSFSFTGYVKNTHEAFTFYSSGWYGVQVVAPISGTIVENGNYSVTIRHNQNLSVKVVGVLSQFRPGEYLGNGNLLGTTLPNVAGSIEFYVYVNGSSVCPLTFFSTTARQQILNVALGTNPCSG